MKILVKLRLNTEEEIDLTDCGYGEDQKWNDLTDEQQNEILDPIRDGQFPTVSVQEIED